METFPETRFDIVGHTDDVGNKIKNKELSKGRADAVRKFLVEKGIAEDRLTADGKGQEQPVASNKTAEGRAKNRRIEFYRKD